MTIYKIKVHNNHIFRLFFGENVLHYRIINSASLTSFLDRLRLIINYYIKEDK